MNFYIKSKKCETWESNPVLRHGGTICYQYNSLALLFYMNRSFLFPFSTFKITIYLPSVDGHDICKNFRGNVAAKPRFVFLFTKYVAWLGLITEKNINMIEI